MKRIARRILRSARRRWDSARYPLRAYADREVTFFLHCYRDPDRLGLALAALRRAYPATRVLVVSDGDPDPSLVEAADGHDAEFTYEPERMFRKEFGGDSPSGCSRLSWGRRPPG